MKKILLIEDDIDLSNRLSLSLNKWGFSVELIDDFSNIVKEFTEKKFKQWSKKAVKLRDSFNDSQIEEFKNELRKLCQSYF